MPESLSIAETFTPQEHVAERVLSGYIGVANTRDIVSQKTDKRTGCQVHTVCFRHMPGRTSNFLGTC